MSNALTRFASNMKALVKKDLLLTPVWSWISNWNPRFLETFPGAWQQNVVVDQTQVAAYWAVFACVTLIGKDIAKMPGRVMTRQSDGTFKKTLKRPVLRKPNHFQNYIEFMFSWMSSLLLTGNTYVLKQRDAQGFVIAMYVLCPSMVTPLVTPDGAVYYRLTADNLANISSDIIVPASEIIHDRMYTLYHPLIGVSPIYACGVSAMQGLAIQNNSTKLFQNQSRPGGILVAPGPISAETAIAMKAQWDTNFSGANIGKVAVLGDGLKYETMTVSAEDSQLIDQLKMTGEMIAACYNVPGYKIGVGPMPTVNNVAALNQQYYDQCLSFLIEKVELRLSEGLEVTDPDEIWLDETVLLRMDPDTRYKAHNEAIRGGWLTPNEARLEENMSPVSGGDSAYLQQQNFSLEALSARDAKSISGEKDVQSSAMNGAQVSSMQGLIVAVSDGSIPPETASAAIAAAFPLLSSAQIDAIINPLKNFDPAPAPGASAPAVAPAPASDAVDQTEAALLALFTRSPESYANA